MKKTKEGQVRLGNLLFTLNWEDPESDLKALNIKPGQTVMTITSGACNTLGFLMQDPGKIHAVDINPCQSYLLELKMAAIRAYSHDDFIMFSGLKPCSLRSEMYSLIRKDLSAGAVDFWDKNLKLIEKGYLFAGRYEKFVKLVGKMIRLIMGKHRVHGLLIMKTPEKQVKFYDEFWDTSRTRFIFNLFFNKFILARRGLKADYFHFDDGAGSFAESFHRKFRHAARELPIRGNYFLHYYLAGEYHSRDEVPYFLQEKHYETIRSRLDRISIVTEDAKKFLASMPGNSIDCFALSNICELMDHADTHKLFTEVHRTALPGSRICFRNLMIPREVPEAFKEGIIRDAELSHEIFRNDRSFVYSKVAAYKVVK